MSFSKGYLAHSFLRRCDNEKGPLRKTGLFRCYRIRSRFPYLKHLRTAHWAFALCRRPTVFHCDLLGALHISLRFAFHAVGFHGCLLLTNNFRRDRTSYDDLTTIRVFDSTTYLTICLKGL